MKKNLLLIMALLACAVSHGQGELDALRYSGQDLAGTARGQAMGGAFGALGADATGVTINPAGIGVYRSSEATVNMSMTTPQSDFLNGKTNFNFSNLSYVGYYPMAKGDVLSLNFGFNYNRVKNFTQSYRVSGEKMNFSLTDYMASITNAAFEGKMTIGVFDDDPYGNSKVPWLSVLAWDGYLIDPLGDAKDRFTSILNRGEQVNPTLNVTEKGKIEVYDFTLGSNISNTFYWGATVSITDLLYRMSSWYEESFLDVTGSGFVLDNYLETKGSGMQVKVGVLFKPVDALRLGFSYHSPTWYSMTDHFYAGIDPKGIYDDDGKFAGYTETPVDGDSFANYSFQTPGSWTASIAAVLGSHAILSVDYENKNYASMKLSRDFGYSSYNDQFATTNSYIKKDFKSASTVRAGLEYRITPQFSARVGYAWMQSPFRSIQEFGEIVETAGTVTHYSLSDCATYTTGGVGYRFTPQFYCDVALVQRTQEDHVYYFSPDFGENDKVDSYAGKFTNKTLRGLLTLGYKF